MGATAHRLRNEARRFSNAERPRASRYSAQFRDEVVDLARGRFALGVPVARIATELGVRSRTLALWLRAAPKRRLRRVKVTPSAEVGPVSDAALVVSAGSLRVEGLDLESVARLIRLLA